MRKKGRQKRMLSKPLLSLFKIEAKTKELAAGPDLDRQIARLIGGEPADTVPPYSTDDATAVEFGERFSREWGWWHYKKREVYGGWAVGWIEERQPLHRPARPIQSSAPTLALAICRSILKVIESIQDPSDAPGGIARRRGALRELYE